MPVTKSKPRKTIDDYMRLPEGVRAELIDGELYFLSPSPRERHQRIVGNLFVSLRGLVEAAGIGRVYLAPFDVHLPSGDIVQPDLVFVATANLGIVQDWIHGAPDLLIEVLSPASPERDRIVKRERYATNGVKEYWIVDGDLAAVEVFTLSGGDYAPHGYFESPTTLQSPALGNRRLSVAPLFD